MAQAVYLDHNATTAVRPAAAEAVAEALGVCGNPSSVHAFGRGARGRVEAARAAVANLVGTATEAVIFTSGGTEANNLALQGCGRDLVLVSAGEHESVLRAVPTARSIPLNRDGLVRLDALERMLAAADAPALVSVMLANNETGVIQPVAAVAEIVHRAGGLLHCDAVQAAGRLPLDQAALGADLLTLSAHKLGGPPGVGALVVAGDLPLAALLRGGGQERGRRAGTENVAAIAGFGVAAGLAAQDLGRAGQLAAWRDTFEARVGGYAPETIVFGAGAPRLPNTSCLATPGLKAETQVIALDLAGVAVSSGSACSSGKVAPSHVLRAMGADPATADCAIRVSLGWTSRESDLERCFAAWQVLYDRSRRSRKIA